MAGKRGSVRRKACSSASLPRIQQEPSLCLKKLAAVCLNNGTAVIDFSFGRGTASNIMLRNSVTIQRSERKTGNSTPSIADVRNASNLSPLSYALIVWCLKEHRDNVSTPPLKL